MSPTFYHVIHLTGIFMIFLAYGGLIVRSLLQSDNKDIRRLGAITSGLGLVLSLVGGFGLLARMGYGWPGWALAKMAIWVILAALIVAINRKPKLAQSLWWVTLVLGVLAVIMVYVRPF